MLFMCDDEFVLHCRLYAEVIIVTNPGFDPFPLNARSVRLLTLRATSFKFVFIG